MHARESSIWLRAVRFAGGCVLAAVLAPPVDAGARQSGTLRLEPTPVDEGEKLALDSGPGADPAVDESGGGLAFVEVASPRATAFVGELLRLEVRFGFDAAFLESALIPLFRRRLDVPVQIEAAWLDEGDAAELARAFVVLAPGGTVSVARNERVARARRLPDRVVGGRTLRVFSLDAPRIERGPGVLRLGSPRLRFAYGTAFREDFVHGRTPTARREAYVLGPDLEIRVDALPEAGRPTQFSGAVGDFRVELHADWSGAPGRSTVRCELTILGEGDLGGALAPDASSFAGFRVLGVLDDRGRARRSLVYDLEPGSTARSRIQPVAFHFFDPRPPGGYRSVETPALELAIGPSAPVDPVVATPAPFGLRVLLLAGVAAVVAGLAAWIAWRAWGRRR